MGTVSVSFTRLNLAALWLSQVCRFLADQTLRIFVVLFLTSQGDAQRDSAWHLVLALFMFPSIILVPIYGALGNALPKRWVLVGSAGWCAVVALVFSWLGEGWIVCVACMALGAALYNPTRFAILPAAAEDTRWPLSRITAAVETGAVLALVAGMILAGALFQLEWPGVPVPPAMAVVLLLNLLCLALIVPASFPSDLRRPEAPLQALVGFFKDTRRIWRHPPARWSLLGLTALRGLVAAGGGAFMAITFSLATSEEDKSRGLIAFAVLTIIGTAVGSALAGWQKDIHRGQVLIPLGSSGMIVVLAWAAVNGAVPWWLLVGVGLCGGLVNVPLLALYQLELPADARGNGMAILNTSGYLSQTVMAALLFSLASTQLIDPTGQMWLVTALAVAATVAAWLLFWPRKAAVPGLVPEPADVM